MPLWLHAVVFMHDNAFIVLCAAVFVLRIKYRTKILAHPYGYNNIPFHLQLHPFLVNHCSVLISSIVMAGL